MNSPQDRIVRKMIDNIVEQNKPVFEKPAAAPASTHSSAPSHAPAANPEEFSMLSRKLEYGFNSLRSDNAELKKQIEELAGVVKMLRNDMDNLRASMRSVPSHSHAPQPQRDTSVNVPPTGMGAPQYKKSEADEAFESKHGEPAHEAPQQARGFAKKDPAADAGVDISKVFYYGKK